MKLTKQGVRDLDEGRPRKKAPGRHSVPLFVVPAYSFENSVCVLSRLIDFLLRPDR